LGLSLGVDLLPQKICTFDCLYCQLGKTRKKIIRRFFYIDLNKFKKELREILKKKPYFDYITISGKGEPTLHKDLDKIIHTIKRITKERYPICVITNSSLLYQRKIRKELREVDLIIPSLDFATLRTFKRINRPHKKISFKKIIEGLINLRKEFKGEIWLEVMLVDEVNTDLEEIKKLKKIIEKISPHKVHLNLPTRPTAYKLSLPNSKKISKIKKILGENVEIVEDFVKRKINKYIKDKEKILMFLRRRPATQKDLTNSLGMDSKTVNRYLKILCKEKKIKEYFYQGKRYFLSDD
jgi:wyosine [tRNA(Phe)-imidazoG37] synthetase (radical SAM superfamily)